MVTVMLHAAVTLSCRWCIPIIPWAEHTEWPPPADPRLPGQEVQSINMALSLDDVIRNIYCRQGSKLLTFNTENTFNMNMFDT